MTPGQARATKERFERKLNNLLQEFDRKSDALKRPDLPDDVKEKIKQQQNDVLYMGLALSEALDSLERIISNE